MTKLTPLTTITSGYLSNEQISNNFDLITTAINNTVSRDGSTPNTITANLDMNSYQLVNLLTPTTDYNAATKKYVDDSTSIIVITDYVAECSASATAAALAETNAELAETNAEIAEVAAELAETNANLWATKTTGIVASSEYSAKAYALGGTGITDTAGKGSAKEWAMNPEDDLVDGTSYSAKHYSIKAAASAASVNLPSFIATDTGKSLHVNAAGTAFELISTMGTSGYVLTSAGADALPSYQVLPSNNLVLLQTQSASTSASISFSSTYLTNTYKQYIIELIDVITATDGTTMKLVFSENNGSAYGSSYNSTGVSVYSGSTTVTGRGLAGNAYIEVTPANRIMGNTAGYSLNSTISLFNPAGTALYKQVLINSAYIVNNGDNGYYSGSSEYLTSVNAINNIKFSLDTGNITSGTFKLYGVL